MSCAVAAVPPAGDQDRGSGELTVLLQKWNQGEGFAAEAVIPFIYDELRWLAGRYLRKERSDHTLQPTALVNEAWMRLVGMHCPGFNNRKHFYAIAARLMRQILVDHARVKLASKRGGGSKPVELNERLVYSEDHAHEYLALHDALENLGKADERKAQIVELRFFSGLTVDEIAEHLEISVSTVLREQRFAEAWLSRYLRHGAQ
jgi:RNA polymerase sigma-70 factor (ECF subfamily)